MLYMKFMIYHLNILKILTNILMLISIFLFQHI